MKVKNLVFWCWTVFLFIWLCPMEIQAESRIFIDAAHKYPGMNASFAKGYEPSTIKDTMTLAVPFTADDKMQKNQIWVGIDFEKVENGPFYYKNYQKLVKQREDGVYLYQCKLKLRKDRVNGQYPLHLWAEGKTKQGRVIHQEFTIYVEITDGKTEAGGKEGSDTGDLPIDLPTEEMFPEDSVSMPGGDIQGSEEERNSQPRIIVSQNSLQGQSLEAGSSLLWDFSIQNCSSRISMENVKITLSCDSKDLMFEKTAWYFEKITAKEAADLSQNISAAKKAAASSVQVQFQVEYEDKKGNSYNSAETVNVWVSQPQHAELASVSFPENVYASDTVILDFQVQNTGLAPVYNARISLEGKGLFPRGEVFLGNMEGGASEQGELQVFAGTLDMDADGAVIEGGGDKYGDTLGTVTFCYEDEQGKEIKQTMEIHTMIREPEIVELKVEKETPQTNQWWITIAAGVFLMLILIIIWLYLRMKYYQRMRT